MKEIVRHCYEMNMNKEYKKWNQYTAYVYIKWFKIYSVISRLQINNWQWIDLCSSLIVQMIMKHLANMIMYAYPSSIYSSLGSKINRCHSEKNLYKPGADPGFSWGGGGGEGAKDYMRTCTLQAWSQSPLQPGSSCPLKGPGSSGIFYAL